MPDLRTAAFLCVLPFPSAWAYAEVLSVGQPGSGYATVQAAVAAARSGDTVRIHAGTYVGNLVLDKTVRIEGIGMPVIRGSGRGSVVLVAADRCEIRGLAIEHSGSDLQAEDSGILLKSGDNVLEGNELRDVLYGIYLYRANRSTIRKNTIRGRAELELGERGAAVHIWDSPGNIIEDNVISDVRDGLYIQSSPGNRIRRNRVRRVRYGVHYMFSDSNSFEDNVFSDSVAGAAIMYSYDIEFRGNAFVHNRGFSSFGILFQECERCTAVGNFIVDNATGIFMEALRASTFRNNVIAENDVALQMFSSAEGNLFCANNFVQNLSPMQLIGRSSKTRWEEYGAGNYWSDYGGYDLDGDGIGDVPHKIQNVFEYVEGNYPRLRLYLESPAAHALAMAERVFPFVQGSPEVDRAPRVKPLPIAFRPEAGPRSPAPRGLLALISIAMVAAAASAMRWGLHR